MAQDAWREDAAASSSVQSDAQQSGDASEALHMGDATKEQSAAPATQGRRYPFKVIMVAVHASQRLVP